MKIAVTGKGGVGKTTLSAVLARMYAEEGHPVLAVDVDPDANLGLALGFDPEDIADITPISKMRTLVWERTGANQETFGKIFKLNPNVSDLPDMFARKKNGVNLLVLGTIESAGAGCVCPEHAVLKCLISSLIIKREEVVIMDMEAGLEHLGRGTAGEMDQFIVVIEPGARSIQTYHNIKRLARELGIQAVYVVANKIRSREDEEFIGSHIASEDLLGMIHYLEDVADADRRGCSPYDVSPSAVSEIKEIKKKIDSTTEK